MSQNYPVFWALTAEHDLLAIIRYIKTYRPKTAVKVFGEIKMAAADLGLFPERGRIVPELLAQGINIYRELIVSPWRIIYRFSGQTLYVLAVIDGRRNVEDILLDRLLRDPG